MTNHHPEPADAPPLLMDTHGWAALGNAGTARTYLDMARIALDRARANGEHIDRMTRDRMIQTCEAVADDAAALVETLQRT